MRWILFVAFFVLFGGVVLVMRPVYAEDILGVGSVGFGLMYAAFGLGALFAAGLLATMGLPKHVGLTIPIAGLVWYAAMVVYAFSRSFPLTLGCEALMGGAAQFWMASVMSGTQMAVSEELRSRALSLVFMVTQLGFIGWILGGFLADTISDTFAVAFSGALPIPFLLYAILLGNPCGRYRLMPIAFPVYILSLSDLQTASHQLEEGAHRTRGTATRLTRSFVLACRVTLAAPL
jgi:MFS family permease